MCGIIGIKSNKPVITNIISSLKKLEYRGYDSAGIATLAKNFIDEVKCEGRVTKLEKICSKKSIEGIIGIGHVRWATHGMTNEVNAPNYNKNSYDLRDFASVTKSSLQLVEKAFK